MNCFQRFPLPGWPIKVVGYGWASYSLRMDGGDTSARDGGDIWRILDSGSATFALLVGDRSGHLLNGAAEARQVEVASVGRLLTIDHPDGWVDPEPVLRGNRALRDIEVLFSPEILVDPLRLLSSLARRNTLIAVWPGAIDGQLAKFSERGRPDLYEETLLAGALVIRTTSATFPDQATFEVEKV